MYIVYTACKWFTRLYLLRTLMGPSVSSWCWQVSYSLSAIAPFLKFPIWSLNRDERLRAQFSKLCTGPQEHVKNPGFQTQEKASQYDLDILNLLISQPLWKHHWHQSLLGTKPVRQLVRVPNQLLCHQLAESRGCSWWAQPAYGNCDHLWPFRINGLLYFAASECRWWRRSAPGSKMVTKLSLRGPVVSLKKHQGPGAQAIITRKPT